MEIPEFRLYLITDRHQTGGRPLAEVVRRALEGGVRAVQLREKDLPGAALYRLRERDFGELKHHGGISPAWPIGSAGAAGP